MVLFDLIGSLMQYVCVSCFVVNLFSTKGVQLIGQESDVMAVTLSPVTHAPYGWSRSIIPIWVVRRDTHTRRLCSSLFIYLFYASTNMITIKMIK